MADTIELAKHIKDIEDKLKGGVSNTLKDLEIPIDFYLNSIYIDFIPIQEHGQVTKKYALRDVKLNVAWKPWSNIP